MASYPLEFHPDKQIIIVDVPQGVFSNDLYNHFAGLRDVQGKIEEVVFPFKYHDLDSCALVTFKKAEDIEILFHQQHSDGSRITIPFRDHTLLVERPRTGENLDYHVSYSAQHGYNAKSSYAESVTPFDHSTVKETNAIITGNTADQTDQERMWTTMNTSTKLACMGTGPNAAFNATSNVHDSLFTSSTGLESRADDQVSCDLNSHHEKGAKEGCSVEQPSLPKENNIPHSFHAEIGASYDHPTSPQSKKHLTCNTVGHNNQGGSLTVKTNRSISKLNDMPRDLHVYDHQLISPTESKGPEMDKPKYNRGVLENVNTVVEGTSEMVPPLEDEHTAAVSYEEKEDGCLEAMVSLFVQQIIDKALVAVGKPRDHLLSGNTNKNHAKDLQEPFSNQQPSFPSAKEEKIDNIVYLQPEKRTCFTQHDLSPVKKARKIDRNNSCVPVNTTYMYQDTENASEISVGDVKSDIERPVLPNLEHIDGKEVGGISTETIRHQKSATTRIGDRADTIPLEDKVVLQNKQTGMTDDFPNSVEKESLRKTGANDDSRQILFQTYCEQKIGENLVPVYDSNKENDTVTYVQLCKDGSHWSANDASTPSPTFHGSNITFDKDSDPKQGPNNVKLHEIHEERSTPLNRSNGLEQGGLENPSRNVHNSDVKPSTTFEKQIRGDDDDVDVLHVVVPGEPADITDNVSEVDLSSIHTEMSDKSHDPSAQVNARHIIKEKSKVADEPNSGDGSLEKFLLDTITSKELHVGELPEHVTPITLRSESFLMNEVSETIPALDPDILNYLFFVHSNEISAIIEGGVSLMRKMNAYRSSDAITMYAVVQSNLDTALDTFAGLYQECFDNLKVASILSTKQDVDNIFGSKMSILDEFMSKHKDTYVRVDWDGLRLMTKEEMDSVWSKKLELVETLCIPSLEWQAIKRPNRRAIQDEREEIMSKTQKATRRPFQFTTEEGLMISVYLADITTIEVDTIVNAANEHLQHGGGVARAISDAAGIHFNTECQEMLKQRGGLRTTEVLATSTGGPESRLNCKKVFHAVGPQRQEYKDDDVCYEKLKQTVFNCLMQAHKENFKSIAIPAISSGIFGVPKHICAKAMHHAVVVFSQQQGSQTKLQDIRFIDSNSDVLGLLMNAFAKNEISKSSKHGGAKYVKKTDLSPRFDIESNYISGSKVTTGADSSSKSEEMAKTVHAEEDTICAICFEEPTNPTALGKCKHVFCKECIDNCFKLHKPVCPTCGTLYGVLTGNQPMGKMDVSREGSPLPGHHSHGTIIITYKFTSGIQQEEHPNPGKPYNGTKRIAFLPDSPEGNKVLRLLRKAFDNRLTFTIGRSTTTGLEDQITWNDIHHKTNKFGGSTGFGYPDPDYLQRVQEELKAKGIE